MSRCTMPLIRLETLRRTKEMDCLIMPIDSRLWFGADSRRCYGVCGGGGEGGGSLSRLLLPFPFLAAAAVPTSAALDKGCG